MITRMLVTISINIVFWLWLGVISIRKLEAAQLYAERADIVYILTKSHIVMQRTSTLLGDCRDDLVRETYSRDKRK